MSHKVKITRNSRYAPIRYEATRPYAARFGKLFMAESKKGPDKRRIFIQRDLLPLLNAEITRLGKPVGPGPGQGEIGNVQIFGGYQDGGRVIFDVRAELSKSLLVTDCRDIPCEAITFPAKAFYLHFGPGTGLMENGMEIEGAFVQHLEAENIMLIDLLPDRYGTSIVNFLHSLSNKEQITHVATDMWRPYRIAVQKALPNAKLVVDKFHVVSKANASFDAVRRSIGNLDKKRHSRGLMRAHKLFAKRQADLDGEQWLTVSGWLNSFPLLKAAYDLKEQLYKVYEVETKEEAWGEYLAWESSIPDELAKPFRPVKTGYSRHTCKNRT